MKVAVASKDGRLIDQHFGHAERFLIYEADGDKIRLVEERRVERYCPTEPEHDYDESRLERVYRVIEDCSLLLVSRIGFEPEKGLERLGIKTVTVYDLIEDGIKEAMIKKEV